MINYADYVFYEKDYNGNLSIDLFNSLIVRASREIDRNINRNLSQAYINKMNEIDQYKLKYATCQMVDYINSNGDVSNSKSADNISIDGVSISKGYNSTDDTKKNKSKIIENLPQELIRFL